MSIAKGCNLSCAHLCRHSRRLQHNKHHKEHKDHKGHHKEHKHHQHDRKPYRYENGSIPDSVNWPEQGIVSPIKNQHVNGSKVRHVQDGAAVWDGLDLLGALLRGSLNSKLLVQHAQQECSGRVKLSQSNSVSLANDLQRVSSSR